MLRDMLWRGKVIQMFISTPRHGRLWGSAVHYHVFSLCGIFYHALSNLAYVTYIIRASD